MIYAKTIMSRIPDGCEECSIAMDDGYNLQCPFSLDDIEDRGARLKTCPLVEIDETLPAQLAAAKADVAAAEARIKKLDRLLDESL